MMIKQRNMELREAKYWTFIRMGMTLGGFVVAAVGCHIASVSKNPKVLPFAPIMAVIDAIVAIVMFSIGQHIFGAHMLSAVFLSTSWALITYLSVSEAKGGWLISLKKYETFIYFFMLPSLVALAADMLYIQLQPWK